MKSAIVFLGSLLLAGSTLAVDTDGDGVDDIADNSLVVPNTGQLDTDGDGCGNACDADYSGDGVVGGADFLLFKFAFGYREGETGSGPYAGYNPDVDHNDDGVVGGPDFLTYQNRFGGIPGPSGLPGRDPVACP